MEHETPEPFDPIEECRRLHAAEKELEEANEAAKAKAKEVRALRLRIADLFAARGVPSMTVEVDGKPRLFYCRTDRRMNKTGEAAQSDVVDALRGLGLVAFFGETYSPQSLTAWVREQHDAMDPGTPFADAVPEELRNLFKTFEETTVVSRSA